MKPPKIEFEIITDNCKTRQGDRVKKIEKNGSVRIAEKRKEI